MNKKIDIKKYLRKLRKSMFIKIKNFSELWQQNFDRILYEFLLSTRIQELEV
jgi:hypothetical protein